MKIDLSLVEEFVQDLKSQGRSQATIESYRRDSKQFVEFITNSELEEHIFDPSTLVQFQQYLVEVKKVSVNTQRRLTISIRQFFRFLAQKTKMDGSPYDFVAIPVRQETVPGQELIEKIKQAVDHSLTHPEGILSYRNAAILALLGFEGLKTSELISLSWGDFHQDGQMATLFVQGTRKRTIELSSETANAMSQYGEKVEEYNLWQEGPRSKQKIFLGFKGKDGSVALSSMTRHGLKFALYEVGEAHKIDHLNAELLRHVAINNLLAEGRSPQEVMNHLGLKRMGIIRKYTRQGRYTNDPVDTHY